MIVPAHNEAEVIGATLDRLVRGAGAGEVEVLVVCNGCSDDTAAVAARTGGPVRVLESSIPSKSEAINTGVDAASGDVIIVMDADVSMRMEDVRCLAAGLASPGVLAAGPRAEMEYLPGTSAAVRGYYAVWTSLPYFREGMMGAGVWAVNRAGLARLGRLPRIISDDGYARAVFNPGERIAVGEAVSRVNAPLTIADLVKIKTRSRLGGYELRAKFPDVLANEARHKSYGGAMKTVMASPRLWLAAIPYLYVNIVSRVRAAKQARNLASYRWERDMGSRRAAAKGGAGDSGTPAG